MRAQGRAFHLVLRADGMQCVGLEEIKADRLPAIFRYSCMHLQTFALIEHPSSINDEDKLLAPHAFGNLRLYKYH